MTDLYLRVIISSSFCSIDEFEKGEVVQIVVSKLVNEIPWELAVGTAKVNSIDKLSNQVVIK